MLCLSSAPGPRPARPGRVQGPAAGRGRGGARCRVVVRSQVSKLIDGGLRPALPRLGESGDISRHHGGTRSLT